MTEKELFEHMKGSTFVEIDSLDLEAIIQSRERKAWETAQNDWNRFESQGESVSLIEGTEAELKQIIFGGGDVSKTNE